MVQYFKGDDTEKKFDGCVSPLTDTISVTKDDFLAGAFACQKVGELIYDNARAPLTNAIKRDIFITSFAEIFDAFVVSGTFESYLTVFRKIFGNTVVITFTVPAAGKLNIAIAAESFIAFDLISRSIVDNAYVLDEVIDYDGNNIAAQSLQGFESEYEINQMLYELVPAGIFTQITLTIG